MDKSRLLTHQEVEAIRAGVRDGLAGPVVRKWVRQLLEDRDERVRLENERSTPARVRARYGKRQRPGADPDWY